MPEINEEKVKTVNKFPIAVTATIFIGFCGILLTYILNSTDKASDNNCKQLANEVVYLRQRIEVLEKREAEMQEELKSYVRTLFLKDAQIKKQSEIINSAGGSK